jgi:hypothetical protein
MSSFYSIPIPRPQGGFQQLAQFSVMQNGARNWFVVEWLKDTRQVIVWNEETDTWLIQPNADITTSLATLLNCKPTNIVAKNLFYGEYKQTKKRFDEEMLGGFYECAWSDYTCDNLVLMFDVEVHPNCLSDRKRLVLAIRRYVEELNEEEDYADMPGLIPIDSHVTKETNDYMNSINNVLNNNYMDNRMEIDG